MDLVKYMEGSKEEERCFVFGFMCQKDIVFFFFFLHPSTIKMGPRNSVKFLRREGAVYRTAIRYTWL